MQGQDNNSWTWRQFLDRNEHIPGAVWPVDAVSFHGYAGPSCGYSTCSADPTNMHSWVGPLVDSAKGVIADATEAAHVIKIASPKTKIFMDEVGILLGIAPFNMSDTLGNGSLSTWWNIQVRHRLFALLYTKN